MNADTWMVHDHGSDWHVCAIIGIAHHLRRLGWETRTTDRIGNLEGVAGPEIDIRASRQDKYLNKTTGHWETKQRIIGIEVEEQFERSTIIRKWEQYRPYRLQTLYIATLSKVRGRPDFGMDEMGIRDIVLIKPDWRDFLGACRLFAEAIL